MDAPQALADGELSHLTYCRLCQRMIALARANRNLITGDLGPTESEATGAQDLVTEQSVDLSMPRYGPRVIKAHRTSWWLNRSRTWMAAAAVLGVAVTIGMLRPTGRSAALLGAVTGRFADNVVRGVDRGLEYHLTLRLEQDAFVTTLYVDADRSVSTQPAKWFRAGELTVPVRLSQDPPSDQWIGVVASRESFDPSALCEEVRQSLSRVSPSATIQQVTQVIDAVMARYPRVTCQGHAFVVPAKNKS